MKTVNESDGANPVRPLFSLGRIVATPAALAALDAHGVDPMQLIVRHARGDWGDVHPEDALQNDLSVTHGIRILSSYVLTSSTCANKRLVVWMITEHDRSVTTFFLPEDY
jgi:hypothetical protein